MKEECVEKASCTEFRLLLYSAALTLWAEYWISIRLRLLHLGDSIDSTRNLVKDLSIANRDVPLKYCSL